MATLTIAQGETTPDRNRNGAHPVLTACLKYWQDKRPGETLPSRIDIDPLDFPAGLLPHIVLINVEHTPRRYRYRLIGTHIVQTLDHDSTGRYIDELHGGELFPDFVDSLDRIVASREPFFTFDSTYPDHRKWANCEAIGLPLASDGSNVDMILVATVYNRELLPDLFL
jgi:hypothetical protein